MPAHYIVTPVLNAVRTIDATIWSVASQAGDLDIYYHVQDGGSTDGTVDKIRQWALRFEAASTLLPARVHFSYAVEPDGGMYDAINKGFARMAIPADAFMNWCNADDALWPGALDAVVRLGRELPEIDWITGWSSWFDDCCRFTAIDRSPRFPQAILAAGLADGIHWPFVQQESTFWRKRLWDKAGGLNAGLRLAGDWDLWARFSRVTPLTHVHRQLGSFYVRPGQQSSALENYWREMNQIMPQAERQRQLRRQVKQGAFLTTLPWACEDHDGKWQLSSRSCAQRAGLAACALKKSPAFPLALTKFIHKYW